MQVYWRLSMIDSEESEPLTKIDYQSIGIFSLIETH